LKTNSRRETEQIDKKNRAEQTDTKKHSRSERTAPWGRNRECGGEGGGDNPSTAEWSGRRGSGES
jgi:hypothetical protein